MEVVVDDGIEGTIAFEEVAPSLCGFPPPPARSWSTILRVIALWERR
jgi:hypothetical protein